jgi:glutathione peroxidase
MPHVTSIIAIALTLTAAFLIASSSSARSTSATPPALDFTMKDIDGKDVVLTTFAGKVVLMVNTASKCGYTPQYKELQAVYEKYKDQGLVILGFPANEFGEQEPGTNEEIKGFCEKTYGVTFPMFAKTIVKGEGICPLYKFLTSSDSDPKFAGEIKWNFTKFLIDRKGEVVNRFESKVKPTSEDMTKAIEAELAKK